MRLIAFDLETTGADPAEARIVTYALVSMTPDGVESMITGLVNPGIDIPEEATAVHGVTTEQAQAGMHPVQALNQIMTVLAWGGGVSPVCAFNARYDMTVLAHELHRHNLPTNLLAVTPVVDPLILDRHFDKYRKGKRTLTAISELYGCPVGDDAHDASADAVAAGRIFYALRERYNLIRQVDLQDLHDLQVTWADEQAVSLEQYLRRTNPDARVDPRWPVALDPVEAADAAA